MTRLDALKELAAKVEAGKWDDRFDEPADETGLSSQVLVIDRIMCNGSLDAAKALHDAVLRGWVWLIDCDEASVKPSWETTEEWEAEVEGLPARAWLLAILRALIAQEESA